ncbi:MAG: hypothetical protein LC808_13880 [Actinobacteria bacterium]|nr:hypothetical protein [Actinomycetota bacterium]
MTEHATAQRGGGMTEVECAVCDWTLPAGRHLDHGTAERPGCADYCDAAMPFISAHLDTTGHHVLVTLTTYSPDREEQSTLRFLPRAA